MLMLQCNVIIMRTGSPPAPSQPIPNLGWETTVIPQFQSVTPCWQCRHVRLAEEEVSALVDLRPHPGAGGRGEPARAAESRHQGRHSAVVQIYWEPRSPSWPGSVLVIRHSFHIASIAAIPLHLSPFFWTQPDMIYLQE